MEPRKIWIIDTDRNNSVEITTGAETFGELKQAVEAAGINYAGKTWMEGITKQIPVDDSSLLPTNVTYKGKVTNNLVYALTNTEKKITSGVMTRQELYNYIRENNLADFIRDKTGKSYTNLSNDCLLSFVKKPSKKTETPDWEALYKALGERVVKFFNSLTEEGFLDIIDDVEEINFTDKELAEMFN